MESSAYVKMLDNNNQIQQVEQDRVLRFLDQGWKVISDQPLGQKKKSPDSMEYKMTVKAQVTSPRSRKKKTVTTPKLNEVVEITSDYTDEVKYDMDPDSAGEDVLLPKDLNNNDKED